MATSRHAKLARELRAEHQLHLSEHWSSGEPRRCVIGFGHRLDRKPLPIGFAAPLTYVDADRLLESDIRSVEHECEERLSMWHARDDVRQRALVALCYAIGIDAVVELKVNMSLRNAVEGIDPQGAEIAAQAVESCEWAERQPEAAKRVAAMLRTGRD